MAVCCLEDFQVSICVNRVRKGPGFICVYCLLYMGNLIEHCRSTMKDRETHSPPRHDIVFDLAKCWAQQQALTRRQSPLKEGWMAIGPLFKVKVVSACWVKLLWLLLDKNLLRISLCFSCFILYLYSVSASTLRFLLDINYLAFSWSSFSKDSVWRKTVSTFIQHWEQTNLSHWCYFFALLSELESWSLTHSRGFCCYLWIKKA